MSGGLGVASTNYGSLLGTTTTNGTTANGFVIDQYYDYQRDQHVTQMWQQQRVSREQQEMEKFIRENASKPGPVPPVHDDLAWLDKRVDEMRVKL